MRIFHIATESDWVAARDGGSYASSTLGRTVDEEGFMHCSRPEQVQPVLDAIYRTTTDPLVLLEIDTDALVSRWQFDDVPEAGQSFPHIYGPLNVDAVVASTPLVRTDHGWRTP